MWETVKELIKKIELQSILVLFITLLFGYLLLNIDNNINTPAGLLGSICIFVGIIYTIASFFSNQMNEIYSNAINVYESAILALKSGHKEAQKYMKNTVSDARTNNKIGGYQKAGGSETGTQND